MYFSALEFLPRPSAFDEYFDEMRRYTARASRQAADEVLREFLGFSLSAQEHHIVGIHHVALYLGDYRTDADVDRWLAFVHAISSVTDLQHGPSYIAPREYGTHGYWISCRIDGASVEMFSNKSAGPWKNYDRRLKISRMSHLALSLSDGWHVKPLLSYLAHYPDISILSYSETDILGHRYGHLLNAKTDCVLELTHSQVQSTHAEPRRNEIFAITSPHEECSHD